MDTFEITVGKDDLYFAAAHFIPFDSGVCETLHGHNYRVAVTLAGRLAETGWVHDFIAVKEAMEGLLAEIDHRTLLPSSNPRLEIEEDGDAVTVRCGPRRFVFPRGDVAILPITNTTAELLAAHLAEGLAGALGEEAWSTVERLEMEVEEAPGQSARCIRRPRGRRGTEGAGGSGGGRGGSGGGGGGSGGGQAR